MLKAIELFEQHSQLKLKVLCEVYMLMNCVNTHFFFEGGGQGETNNELRKGFDQCQA